MGIVLRWQHDMLNAHRRERPSPGRHSLSKPLTRVAYPPIHPSPSGPGPTFCARCGPAQECDIYCSLSVRFATWFRRSRRTCQGKTGAGVLAQCGKDLKFFYEVASGWLSPSSRARVPHAACDRVAPSEWARSASSGGHPLVCIASG